ncbi:MAG: hypothetical protein J5835_00715 [Bacteroidales bacterium]|nr:hypothetical protein [Bacteroidales bacterium]
MKQFNILLRILLPLTVTLVACSRTDTLEEESPTGPVDGMVLSASLNESVTKTTLSGPSEGKYQVLWKTGDKISVNGTLSNAVASADNGKKNVDFTVSGSLSAPFKVLYPGTTEDRTISLPATQNYVAGSFDGAAAASYGTATKVGDKYNAKLTSFCGVLRFALKGSATLSKIELNSLGDECLYGDFDLTVGPGGFTGSFNGGEVGTLTYNIGGVTLSGSDTYFYVAIPAQTYASGIEALVYQTDGAYMRLKFWGSGNTLANSDVIEFESKTYAAGRTENLLQINALTAESGGTPTSAPPSVTVAVYNLKQQENRSGTYGDYISMDRADVQECMGYTIAGLNADIIGFNELSSDYLAGGKYDVKAMAGAGGMITSNYGWYLEYPNKVDRSGTVLNYSYSATMQYANGFAFNKNTLTLEEENYVWISQTENDYWSTKKNAYENSAGRHTCVWAKFTHKVSGKQFYFFVTHFATYIGESASNQQKNTYNTQSLETFAKAKVNGALPVIVVGDLNYGTEEDNDGKPTGETVANYTTLTSYWTDSYAKIKADGNMTSFYQKYCGTLSGSSHSYTYPWTSFTKDRPNRRLDYVLTKSGESQNITPVEYRTVRRTYTAEDDEVRTASDHLPVVVKINFQ